jgi:hypothetical protein
MAFADDESACSSLPQFIRAAGMDAPGDNLLGSFLDE